MGIVALRVYNRERYKEYVVSIIKKVSSTIILMEYLKISNSIKETLPAGVLLEIKRLNNKYYCICTSFNVDIAYFILFFEKKQPLIS